jgi:hypothetical protein
MECMCMCSAGKRTVTLLHAHPQLLAHTQAVSAWQHEQEVEGENMVVTISVNYVVLVV